MPKERIKQGSVTVVGAPKPRNEVRTLDGKGTGVFSREVREYQAGEKLKPGEVVEEEPSFDIHWTKMGTESPSTASLSVTVTRELIEKLLEENDDEYIQIYSSSLSRADLNRLIRLGRHVRDSAHGVDE